MLNFDLDDIDEAPALPAARLVAAKPDEPVKITVQEGAAHSSIDAIRAAYLAYGRSGIGDNRRLSVVLAMTSYRSEVEISLNLRKFQPDENFTDEILRIPGVVELSI